MIKVETILNVRDNSGAKSVKCIKIFKKTYSKIGDIILVSIRKQKKGLKEGSKVIKGKVYKGLIIRTVYKKKDLINNYINFDENSVILLNNQNQPIFTRILGPVTKELRKIKTFKIISLSSKII